MASSLKFSVSPRTATLGARSPRTRQFASGDSARRYNFRWITAKHYELFDARYKLSTKKIEKGMKIFLREARTSLFCKTAVSQSPGFREKLAIEFGEKVQPKSFQIEVQKKSRNVRALMRHWSSRIRSRIWKSNEKWNKLGVLLKSVCSLKN